MSRVRSLLVSAAASYDAALQRYPTSTKTATAVAIACAGDVACQRIVQGKGELDPARTIRIGVFSAGITPAVSKWYLLLARHFPNSPLKRVVADQLIFAPIGTTAYFSSLWAMGPPPTPGSTSSPGLVATLSEKVPSALRANYMIWPAIQLVNFALVPARFQVLAVNVAGFFWNIVLSEIAHRHVHAAPQTFEKGDVALPLPILPLTPHGYHPPPAPGEDVDGTVHATREFGVQHQHSTHSHATTVAPAEGSGGAHPHPSWPPDHPAVLDKLPLGVSRKLHPPPTGVPVPQPTNDRGGLKG
jgi:protein Mpv17